MSQSTTSLRLAPEGTAEPDPAPATGQALSTAPPRRPARKRAPAARTAAPDVIDLTKADDPAAGAAGALAAAVQQAVGDALREHLPGLLEHGLQGALAPLSGEVATAFADVEFSVQRTTVLETRATVAEARATAEEHRARTAEDRLDGTRARAALLEDQVAALRAQVAGLQAQVGELTPRPTGWLRRRRA